MASKTQKVITPENLGRGIAYNPQTKKWEVHFVSEAEIEQVTNYVEPQEDDEHYVAKECIKLRDRASGYMWDSCKSILKDRAPARDEDAAIPTPTFRWESGRLSLSDFDHLESKIDGVRITGTIGELPNFNQFETTEALNNYLRDKKITYTTTKRFADTLEGKPMIRPTTLEASYPVLEDQVVNETSNLPSINHHYFGINESENVVSKAIQKGQITITGSITYGGGEKRGQTKTFNIPASILEDALGGLIYNGEVTEIASEDIGSAKNHITITASPKNITLQDLGHTYNITFEDFDNGVEIRNERNIQASDLSNVHWDPLNEQGGAILSDKYRSIAADPMKVLNLSYTTKNGVQHVSGGISVTEANAKLANEARRGKTFTIDQVRGFTEDNGTTVNGGSIEYPWVDLPYIETNATVSWKDVNDQGASLDVVTVDNDQDGYIAELIKNRLKEMREAGSTFILSDLDGSNEERDENNTSSNYENPTFIYASKYNAKFDGSGKQFKLRVEFKPVVIEAFVGKFTVNFQPIEHITTA